MKKTFSIDRRQLLKAGLSSTVVLAMPLTGIALAENDIDILTQSISKSDKPVNSDKTGTLTQAEFRKLASLCTYVNKTWQLDADMEAYLDQLEGDLEYKTSEKPGYLTEYKNAITAFDVIAKNSKNIDDTWATLLFASFSPKDANDTRIARARHFVFSEIIAHQIPISGAFKSFGLINYNGYFGGSYLEKESYTRGQEA